VWKTSYVYLGGRLLATTSGAGGTETRFHHPGRLGTRLVTDAGGTVVSEQWTLPFGNMQPFTSVPGGENPYQHPTLSNPSKKRFTSYDRSEATKLDYAVNRFYSPQQGRFTQVDPIEMEATDLENPQTLNLYAYCGNDPINHVDPDGLFWSAIGSFFKAIGRGLAKIGKAIVDVFNGGRRGSSGPGARTPPTFPSNTPSISLGDLVGGILGNIPRGIGVNVDPRTPPFVGGLAALFEVNLPGGFDEYGGFRTPNTFPGGVSNFLQDEYVIRIHTVEPAVIVPIVIRVLFIIGRFLGRLLSRSRSVAKPAVKKTVEMTPEKIRSIASLEKRIIEHQKKLAEFKANPTPRPGTEHLPKEIQQKTIEGRIKHLEQEIQTFKDNIEKIRRGEL
ncbi:MAG: RHS repeat-associated core domain-containing protein, partial [Blastocatellia bacterium]